MRRVLILVLAAAVLLPAAHGIGGMLPAGIDRYLTLGCACGLLLSALWRWSGFILITTSWAVASILALILLAWPQHQHPIAQSSGLVFTQVAPRMPNEGAALALTVVAVFLAVCCGRLLFEQRTPWPVVALAGSALLVRADVSRAYEDRFPLFILAAVALVIVAYLPATRRLWITFPALLAAAGFVLLSWHLPAARNLTSPDWSDPVSSLADTRGAGLDPGGSSRVLTLVQPFHPSNQLVMSIDINQVGLRPYWQMVVFDRYDGHSWSASESVARPVPAQASLAADGRSSDILARVEVYQPMLNLISAGAAVSASIPTVALYPADQTQPVEVRASRPLVRGDSYDVVGRTTSLPMSRGQIQPYLQLPLEPARVIHLAQRLAHGRQSILDVGLSIQSYLRDSGRFRYDINAASPPGSDAVDDFLFHSHRGFCTQFASAMVILAREVGIPARLVSGYDTGTVTPGPGTFEVRARDAHSWVQLYVYGAGWISLDPTPGFDAAPWTLPNGHARAAAPVGKRQSGTPRVKPLSGSGWARQQPKPQSPAIQVAGADPGQGTGGQAIVVGLFLFLLLAGTGYVIWPRSLRQLYVSIVRAAPRRYGRPRPADTPREFAERFRRHAGEYEDVRLLAGLYMRQCYARIEPTADELRAARRAWLRLRRDWLLRAVRI